MKKNTAITQLILISAIVAVLLMISAKFYFRIDFTEDKRYTLSKATEDILDDLNDVITVKAYFTKDMPPQLVNIRQEFENLLVEYEDNAHGNLVFEIINPNESDELENEAQQNGISPFQVNIQEKDQVKQQRAYLGLLVEMGDKSEPIPMLRPDAGMEYPLTTAIKKLAVEEKPKVALISGQGEPSLNSIVQLNQQLSVLYDVETYELTDTAEIPAYYKSVIMLEPKDSMSAGQFQKLDNYLNNDGNLFLAYNQLDPKLQQGMLGVGNDIGIKSWLSKKGINLQANYVIDAQCMPISYQQRQGPFVINRQIEFPYLPVISTFEDHPIVKGLESVVLPFASSISYTPKDSATQFYPLAFTSDKSGAQNAPIYVDIQKEWTESDFTAPSQLVALALEKGKGGSNDSKIVFISNGSFVTNGEGQQQQGVNEDNINFASNAIDWLSDDTGLIDLRTKAVTNRPIKQLDDTAREMYKWGNFLLPILIILIIGLIRKQQNARKKQKWLQGTY